MNDAVPPDLWHGPPPGRLRLDPIDPLVAVYDRASGQTHLLLAPMPQILSVLETGPANTAAIEAHLERDHGLESEAGNRVLLTERLEELAALGLVERG
jgi:PqqD family protein of HPr-rel-A system